MKWIRQMLSLTLAGTMALSIAACGNSGSTTTESTSTETNPTATETQSVETGAAETSEVETSETEHRGTIMWLSNLSSGVQYDATVGYCEAIASALGYDFTVVYGDSYNDAAGNLNAVKNGMTNDVVGLIASQDGGLAAILEEYPDLYVCGYNTDMRSVYDEGGENVAALENDHFLGTICDGYADGAKLGEDYADAVIEKGYTKVALVKFPVYAYPNQSEAEGAFLAAIEAYNATAAEPVEIVGETTTLEFQPLADSFFLEEGRDDLDAVVSFCNGFLFVYPTMVSAKGNGTCSADTKLLTGGFEDDASIVADIGDEGTISWLEVSPAENPAYAMIMLDNAISGNQYADFEALRVDGNPYIIDSAEDIANVMEKSMLGTGDVSLTQLSVEQVLDQCVRFNPDATQAQLIELMHSDLLTADALK